MAVRIRDIRFLLNTPKPDLQELERFFVRLIRRFRSVSPNDRRYGKLAGRWSLCARNMNTLLYTVDPSELADYPETIGGPKRKCFARQRPGSS